MRNTAEILLEALIFTLLGLAIGWSVAGNTMDSRLSRLEAQCVPVYQAGQLPADMTVETMREVGP